MLTLNEGQDPANVQIKSTVPLGCRYKCRHQEREAYNLTVSVHLSRNWKDKIALLFEEIPEDSAIYGSSVIINKTVEKNTGLSFPVKIYPKDDGVYGNTQMVNINFQLKCPGSNWNGSLQVCDSFKDLFSSDIYCLI